MNTDFDLKSKNYEKNDINSFISEKKEDTNNNHLSSSSTSLQNTNSKIILIYINFIY
jgi:hypothetical protein